MRVVTDDDAVRWVQYHSNKPEGCYDSGKNVICGIPGTTDGTWHTVMKDMQADISAVHASSTITKVNFIRFKGSGRVDDIKLLESMPSSSEVSSTYTYLDSTQRIAKESGGGESRVYFGAYVEVDNAGNHTNNYFADSVRVALEDPTGLFYNHQDHLSSAAIVTSDDSSVVQRIDYNTYGGERLNESTGFATNYTYTDQEKDGESNLMYYGARYYDPTIGRFTQIDRPAILDERLVDIIQDPQALNGYSYARNNPIFYVDDTGEQYTPHSFQAGLTRALRFDGIRDPESSFREGVRTTSFVGGGIGIVGTSIAGSFMYPKAAPGLIGGSFGFVNRGIADYRDDGIVNEGLGTYMGSYVIHGTAGQVLRGQSLPILAVGSYGASQFEGQVLGGGFNHNQAVLDSISTVGANIVTNRQSLEALTPAIQELITGATQLLFSLIK